MSRLIPWDYLKSTYVVVMSIWGIGLSVIGTGSLWFAIFMDGYESLLTTTGLLMIANVLLSGIAGLLILKVFSVDMNVSSDL